MQSWVHHLACPFYVASILYDEGLEWNDRQGVLHLTLCYGVAACQLCLLVCVGISQVAVAYQVEIVGVSSVEPALYVGTLYHADVEVHVHTVNSRTADSYRVATLEVCECHQFLQSVVSCDRRVAQYVVQVG